MINRIKADAQALAAAEAGEWETCAARLNAIAQPTRKPIEQSRFTWVGLQKALGDTQYLTIRTKIALAIRQAEAVVTESTRNGSPQDIVSAVASEQRLKSFFDVLGTSPGPAFADDQTQANIATLVAILTQEEVDALAGLGYLPKPIVTAQDCQGAWRADLAASNRSRFDQLWNEHASPVVHDIDALKAALAVIAGLM